MSSSTPLLHGHSWMELAELLNAARDAPNALPLPWASRRPRSRFEEKLRRDVLRQQECRAPGLRELGRDIAAYGEQLLRSGFGPAIERLSAERALAEVPLVPGGSPHHWNRFATIPPLRQAR